MLKELHRRDGGGIVVELLWDDAAPAGRDVLVKYRDSSAHVSFSVWVPPARALDAFHHPNAYAPAVLAPREPQAGA